ncbi:MAG: hypothetical protein ABIU11_07565 [Chitinophagaceae bacterium]
MKAINYLKIILLLFVFIPFISFSQGKNAVIRVIQNQSSVLGDFQTNLVLKKSSFKFQILLENIEGVYVFASIKDSVYRFTETSVIQDFSYLQLLELRDGDQFNTNKELNISETGWSYWFYKKEADWHPFSRKIIGVGKGRYVGTKVIKQLYDIADGKVIKLRNINTPLYLFFLVVKDYDQNGKPSTELMRRKVKIDWEDED